MYTQDTFDRSLDDLRRLMHSEMDSHYSSMFCSDGYNYNLAYHYTTIAGFQSILTNGCLWASNIHFLNDWLEYEEGKKLCINTLKEFIISSDLSDIETKNMSEIINCLENESAIDPYEWSIDNIFVTSFCAKSDLLSQWRGYGGESGISIGFDYSLLKSSLIIPYSKYKFAINNRIALYEKQPENSWIYETIPTEVKFIKVEYDSSINKKHFLNTFKNYVNAMKAIKDFKAYICASLLRQMFPAMKNNGFKEECELRLIAHYSDDDVVDISYRLAGGILVPYINFRILDGHGNPYPTVLPIKDIVIGPGRNQENVLNSVIYFLKHQASPELKGLSDLAKYVRKSDIPFNG